MSIQVSWDAAPVQTQFGECLIIADGVATFRDGRTYRVNASATRGARNPEVMLRFLSTGRRGAIVPENQMRDVRAAALASFAELLKPMRAAIVAKVQADDLPPAPAPADEVELVRGYMEVSADYSAERLTAIYNDNRKARTHWLTRKNGSPLYDFDVPGRAWLAWDGETVGEFIGNYPAPVTLTRENAAAVYQRRLNAAETAEFLACDPATRLTIACEELNFDPDAPRPLSVMVANTTRAVYWSTAGGYQATRADDPIPLGLSGYARLDALMRLKGENAATIARCCDANGKHKESTI